MIKLKTIADVLPKNYVKHLHGYRFASLLELVLSLFLLHKRGTRDLDDINILLEDLRYDNLKQIPDPEKEAIRHYVDQMMPEWKRDQDEEKQTYLLLASFLRREIVVFIDNTIIENIDNEIVLTDESIITFVDHSKISRITFTTL